MTTIPASHFVAVNPSVLSAGGDALDLSGLLLSTSIRVPIGAVQSFPSQAAVAAFFGSSSAEAGLATNYFSGFNGSTAKPGAMLVAQYNTAAVYAWLRGANISTLTLAQLQALNGTLNVTIDSVLKTASINLSAATSFSNAGVIINDALAIAGVQTAQVTASAGAVFTGTGSGTSLTVTGVAGVIHPGDGNVITGTGVPASTSIVAQVSGTPGGAGTYTTNNPTTSAAATITCTSTTLDVTGVISGTIAVGNVLSGSGVSADTYVASFGTGGGGTGTYTLTVRQQFASTTVTAKIPGVFFDSVSGAFQVNSGTTGTGSTITFGSGSLASGLGLTQANGATISQGSAAATPTAFMNAVIVQTQNWATFFLGFDPDGGSGNAQKLLFAQWVSGQNQRYGFICWDADATPSTTVPATTSLGQVLATQALSGTALIWVPATLINAAGAEAAFVSGSIASIDFEQRNGRSTLAYRSQTGLIADVTTLTVAANLEANNYNYYGAVATANQGFIFFYDGSVSGPFLWLDSYVNQIWMNNAFQLALMELLTNVGSIPFNNAGDAIIESALNDPITAALNFGAIRAGVTLSAAQVAAVNNQTGVDAASTIQNRGWYLAIIVASPTVRQARGPKQAVFYYTDGQSVQTINLGSIELT